MEPKSQMLCLLQFLSTLFLFFIYYVCILGGVCMYVHMHVGYQVSFSVTMPFDFWGRVLDISVCHTQRWGYRPQPCGSFLHSSWGFEPRSSCLHNKHCTDRTISSPEWLTQVWSSSHLWQQLPPQHVGCPLPLLITCPVKFRFVRQPQKHTSQFLKISLNIYLLLVLLELWVVWALMTIECYFIPFTCSILCLDSSNDFLSLSSPAPKAILSLPWLYSEYLALCSLWGLVYAFG